MRPDDRELENLRSLLALARGEDLGSGDVTGELLPADLRARGRFVAREGMVVCGAAFLAPIAAAYDSNIRTTVSAGEGDSVAAGAALAEWTGPARGVLAAERVALNFLQRLSGIATATRRYVDAAAGGSAEIYDTRKTTPGWRRLEKYAVRCGGGRNHRMGLHDAVLVKDNHLAALAKAGHGDPLSAIAAGFDEARRRLDDSGFIEVEVDTLEEFQAAVSLGADVILLDNMTPDQMRQAVALRDQAGLGGRLALEASGGVNLANVREVADTGVDRIAIGAITHSAVAVDIGFDMVLD